MHHPLDMNPHVGILEPLDWLPAPMTVRKEREGVSRDLVENRVVVPAG